MFVVGYCEGTLRSFKIQILRPNATAKLPLVFDIDVYCGFSKKITENLNIYFFANYEKPNTLFGGCQNPIGGCESHF